MHVIDLEQPLGVVVQFGGQTAINLADKLVARGVKILGTSLEDIDRAEDRHEFEEMLHKLDIPQPQGETAVEVEEAVKIANRIGYPVLVRPSYVLGGRAMEIVHNDDDLRVYMATAVKEISHDASVRKWKWMQSVMESMYTFRESWSISSVPVCIPVTPSVSIRLRRQVRR